MRKILVALMIVAFAATAFADVKLSGTYHARGNYMQNVGDGFDDDSDDKQMYYDHDLDLWIKANTDKDTYFKARLELVDEQWGTLSGADVSSNEVIENTEDKTSIELERAWLGHNFGALTLDVGLMTGGAWGYAFGNDAVGKYRVKATIPAGPGNVYVILQKNSEQSYGVVTKDAEKDDSDTYYLAYKGKFGGLTVAPLVAYAQAGNATIDQDVDTTISVLDLAVGGNFGAIGFETEFIYKSYDNENSDNDPATWAAYGNIFGKVAGAKVGFISAYDEPDEDNGMNGLGSLGADFDDTYLLALGDYESMSLTGQWANILYAEYAVNDKTGVTASFAYVTSNIEDDDTTAMEVDLGVSYKITSALKYSVDFAYATADFDSSLGDDPDAAILLQHTLKISF